MFLGGDIGNNAARLYAFCRLIDDIVDEPDDGYTGSPDKQLKDIKSAIVRGNEQHVLVGDFVRLCKEQNINPKHGLLLIDGVQSDTQKVEIPNQARLIHYAFLVAGVVGLMMAPILKAPRIANSFAVDLGIAMQLTNIARDVLEDAKNGRRYIPGDWVDNLSPSQIANPTASQKKILSAGINRLLNLAEKYYESGMAGIQYIPHRNQLGIQIAGTVYREIGRVLEQQNLDYMQGRVVVSHTRKISLAVSCFFRAILKTRNLKDIKHQTELHWPIQNLINSG